MHDPSTVVRKDEEDVERLEANGGHREEVYRDHRVNVVLQEGPPRLGGGISAADHVFAHAGPADVDAQLEEFAVDAPGTPNRVGAAHLANQFADLPRHRGAPGSSAADLPGTEQAEFLAMPGNHGSRFHDAEERAPFGPCSTKPSPQQPVAPVQPGLLHRTLQHTQLMAKGENLKLQCGPGSKRRQRRGKQGR